MTQGTLSPALSSVQREAAPITTIRHYLTSHCEACPHLPPLPRAIYQNSPSNVREEAYGCDAPACPLINAKEAGHD